ncbi:hypothetical protein FB45DRAFT_761571 [Roridomyces roridus]|uniref:Uncharacterized protein n=1 Tax=Roridomyces roridus TaxID=1738132 RepID=A0AAD7B442_9AGAR|nr:hypothetical protein FB45DRAFT_761571 [Roridomyces roridus]
MSTSTKQNQAQLNDELILVLSKMGVYVERDRVKLDRLSSTARTARLRKALDRTVENCCIFPLLFPQKEDRATGKLVLSTLPEWQDWRVARRDQLFRLLCVIHFIDRPYSVSAFLQKQTGLVEGTMILGTNGNLQAPMDNTPIFNAVVRIIQSKSSEKDTAEAAYFWAIRKGDCVEVDLIDLPDQWLVGPSIFYGTRPPLH